MKQRLLDDSTLNLTLCCIDCAHVPLAMRAFRCSLPALPFKRAIFLSDVEISMSGVEWIKIPRIGSREEYSRFVVKSLNRHIDTSHVLLIQWDGYIVNPAAWSEEFLDYDYIGAPWGFHQDNHRVGNGGFSLRSKRLLEALADPDILELDPEDEAICRRYRTLLEQRHSIRFAPESLAARFSFETTYPEGIPFGFHGLFNIWTRLDGDEFDAFAGMLTPAILGSIQLLQLGRNFKDLGRRREAAILLKRRLKIFPDDRDSLLLLRELEPRPAAASLSRNAPCPCGSGKRYKDCCGRVGTSGMPPAGKEPSLDELLQQAVRCHQQGDHIAAQTLYQQVLKAAPSHAMAQHYLGVLYMQYSKLDEAESLLRESLESEPNIPDFHNNLGLCLRARHRLEDAVGHYRKALELRPDYAEAYSNMGLDLQQLGKTGEARECFERAIHLRPDFAEAHWNLALALLLTGEFKAGWQEYEWRLRCPQHTRTLPPFPANVPEWKGEPLQGESILVLHEQGAGDNFQFIRLVPLLAQLGARVIVETPPELSGLLCNVKGVDACFTGPNDTPPKVDYCIRMLSLPYRLGVNPFLLPAAVPYLTVEHRLRDAWHMRLKDFSGLKVGVVWAGNPQHANDSNRSCQLEHLSCLFELAGINWFSMQKGSAAIQLKTMSPRSVVDVADVLSNYSDTAALMANLDLIVTVDTSVAHLAGALGRPCWVMLPFSPDFRWLLEREDSPWYPSIRLFRQKSSGDWPEVASQIFESLKTYSENNL